MLGSSRLSAHCIESPTCAWYTFHGATRLLCWGVEASKLVYASVRQGPKYPQFLLHSWQRYYTWNPVSLHLILWLSPMGLKIVYHTYLSVFPSGIQNVIQVGHDCTHQSAKQVLMHNLLLMPFIYNITWVYSSHYGAHM